MTTLLEKAKQTKKQGYGRTQVTSEDEELILAYLKDEVSSSQVRNVKGKDGVQFYSYALIVVKKLFDDKKIVSKDSIADLKKEI